MKERHFPKLLLLNLLTSSHCMIAQMALSMTLSYIFSNSVGVFTFFTGLYLMAMGLGSLLVEKIDFDRDKFLQLLFLNSCLGIILANPGIVGIILANEFLRSILGKGQADFLPVIFPLGIVLTALIGMVSGAELPLFSKLIEKENWHPSKPIIGVLTSDYFGAFAGVVLFTFILSPFVGLMTAILVSQIITLSYLNAAYGLLSSAGARSGRVLGIILALDGYVALTFLLRERIFPG